jgi:hypothetical protein
MVMVKLMVVIIMNIQSLFIAKDGTCYVVKLICLASVATTLCTRLAYVEKSMTADPIW